MKKKQKSVKGKRSRARAVKDLTVSDVRQVKGGDLAVPAKGATFPKAILYNNP